MFETLVKFSLPEYSFQLTRAFVDAIDAAEVDAGNQQRPGAQGSAANVPPAPQGAGWGSLAPHKGPGVHRPKTDRPNQPRPQRGGRGSSVPHKGPGAYRPNLNDPAGLPRPVGSQGFEGGLVGGDVARGRVECTCEGSSAHSSLLSTVSGTVGGTRNRCSSPADRVRVGRRASENYES